MPRSRWLLRTVPLHCHLPWRDILYGAKIPSRQPCSPLQCSPQLSCSSGCSSPHPLFPQTPSPSQAAAVPEVASPPHLQVPAPPISPGPPSTIRGDLSASKRRRLRTASCSQALSEWDMESPPSPAQLLGQKCLAKEDRRNLD